ncbi:MAG: 50S ribosomal protein L21 [Syntrophomonadaceae bacterium]|nr:50S ribosomal protein L21 [Syntrophomonadaceae bacterium]
MYAVIKSGGKQYRVQEGEVIRLEKLGAEVGETVEFDQVLAVKNESGLKVGNPFLAEVKVQGRVLAQDKAKKIIVFKYKAKKNYRKKQGHRQPYTSVRIEKIIV